MLTLDIDGKEQLALTKALEIHPIRRNIQHADLLVVRRGEKVTVEVNVIVEGEAAPGTLVTQDTNTIEIEADVQAIPEQLTVSVEGADIGTQFTAGSIALPDGVSLISDPEMLVVNVVAAPTAEDLEAEGAGEVSRGRGRRRRGRRGCRGRRRRGRWRGIIRLRRILRVTDGPPPDMAEPLLVVGLGNPGPNYAKTRHNLGFMVADLLADRMGEKFKVHKKSGAEVVTGRLAGRSVVLAKPRVYMNESGRQVGPLAKFYSVPPADVVIVHDELDIDFGRIRLKFGGGVGGSQRSAFGGIGLGHQRLSAGPHRHRPSARPEVGRRRSCWRTSTRPSGPRSR